MPICEEFACVVCGICKNKPRKSETKKTPDAKPHKGVKKGKRKAPGQIADSIIVYVYGKVQEGGTLRKQLDVYSVVNGYHIRSIPAGERWMNPVVIGAGDGYLAVVDRFQDYDVIRVTDEYAGAGEDGFDEDGFPIGSVEWGKLDDLCQVKVPNGYRCTGVTVLGRGLLIANLVGGDGRGRFLKGDIPGRINGDVNKAFDAVPLLKPEGVSDSGQLCSQPAPKTSDTAKDMYWFVSGVRGDEYAAIYAVDAFREKVAGILSLDDQKGILGVGFGDQIATVALGTKATEENERDRVDQIIRFVVENQNSYVMGGRANKGQTPGPEEYQVKIYPAYADYDALTGGEPQEETTIRKYWRLASDANERRVPKAVRNSRNQPDEIETRKFKDPQSSTELNDNRNQSDTKVSSSGYDQAELPVVEIDVPEKLQLRTITSAYGVVVELFNRYQQNDQSKIDTTQPVFRLLHASHYDIVCDGGFTYGSVDPETEEATVNTNGMIGESIAIDKSYAIGKLKETDLRAALVDVKTGLLVYWFPKALKGSQSDGKPYQIYSGSYASLKPYAPLTAASEAERVEEENRRLRDQIDRLDDQHLDWNQKHALQEQYEDQIEDNQARIDYLNSLESPDQGLVHRTSVTDKLEEIATGIDGIERPDRKAKRDTEHPAENGDTFVVPEFENDEDCDHKWALFIRRVQSPKKVVLQPDIKYWTMREPLLPGELNSAYFPEYRSGMLSNPVQVDFGHGVLWPPRSSSANEPEFVCVGAGGFFVPNWKMAKTTTHTKAREEIADLEDANKDLQAALDREEDKPEAAQDARLIDFLNQQIKANENRIDALENQIAETDDENLVEVPRSLLKHQFRDIDVSPGQEFKKQDDGSYTCSVESMTPLPDLAEWETGPIGERDDLARACAFDTDVRTWVALDYRFERWGYFTNGCAGWVHPETVQNGLGIVVGDFDWENIHGGYAEAFGIVAGSIYESGYRSYWDIDGAEGVWRYEVLFDGVSVNRLIRDRKASKATYWDIFWRAPEELRDRLISMWLAKGHGTITPGRGEKGSAVYFTPEVVETVTIKAQLWNYAFDVFRYGFRTIQFKDTSGDSPICPKIDPGYWAGDNCEAAACGNLTCSSRLFGGNHKLYKTDPTYPLTVQLVWEGQATFSFKGDPYADLGVLMGRFFDCYVDFDLMNPMNAFNVDIREGVDWDYEDR